MQENPIFARIRKLMALGASGSGATEAEATTAATMIQRILQDNGLTMAEVEAKGGDTGADGKRSKAQSDRRALFKWQQSLMASLAQNFFCMHSIEVVHAHDGRKMRKSKQHVLIGRFINVQTTINTYDYLTTAIRRAADAAGFKHEPATEKQHHMFLEGATDRLRDRLAERRVEREAEDERKRSEAVKASPGTGTALVVADLYQNEADLNQDMAEGLAPGTTTRERLRNEAAHSKRMAVYEGHLAEGVEEYEAWFLAYGYSPEGAKEASASYRKSQEREEKASGRGSGWSAKDQAAHERRNSTAYRAGQKAGSHIGLDDQIKGSKQGRIG